jgi:outer membrane protein assembly factor BamB
MGFKINALFSILLCFALSAMPASAAEAAGAAETAKAVFTAAGVQAGLCLHLGCGRADTAGLTAALAEGSGMPVHGLAFDDASVMRARAAIEARGVAGRAMVEKHAGKSLPYVPDLARLIVVEDLAALTAQGINQDELMRVLAPTGVLCTRAGGKWVATTKPRPPEMDEWTHPHHGPDGNLVSTERTITFPIDLRWTDSVPTDRGGFGSCASCRAVVLAGGRCFTVNTDDLGSNGRAMLKARDAYSGFPLWYMDCLGSYGKVELDWRNVWPLAANDRRVYVGRTNDMVIADAASGSIVATCPTRYEPHRLVLIEGTVVVASWQKRDRSNFKDGFENDQIRSVWWPGGEGSVEAFDAETGKPKWALPLSVLTVVASDKTVYLLTHQGNPPTERTVVAVDLATGKEKWRVPHTAFGVEADTCLNFAGPGCAVVSKSKNKGPGGVFVLSAADGKVLVSFSNTIARAIVGNELWCTNERYNLRTGQKVPGPGLGRTYAGVNTVGGCVPPIVLGGGKLITGSRQGGYALYGDDPAKPPTKLSYQGARGACLQGMVPANGMFYTAQNNCGCFGAQIPGFLALGPGNETPKPEEFTQPRLVEKGPAFGAVAATPSVDEWPTYRQNVERSAGTTNNIPAELQILWEAPCVKLGEGAFADAWDSRIGAPQPLTAPIMAAGMVFVGGVHSGQLMALDPATGSKIWTTLLGSRIDSPPTYYKCLLLLGCHDGWVYAFRAKDGVMAYRMRAAPRESRVMDHGLIESSWPATGAVLVYDGLAYVTAGRSTEILGGIALLAFKPETGETVWAKGMGEKTGFLIDAFSVQNGELAWRWMRLDPKSGAMLPPAQKYFGRGGMLDGSWTMGFTKSGGGFSLGRVAGSMLAWNERLMVGAGWAVAREKVEAPKPPPNTGVKHPDSFKPEDYSWKTQLEPHIEWARVHAMALTGNSALFAGSVLNGWANNKYDGSFLWIKSTADGKTRQKQIPLAVAPSYDGLAVANGQVYLALQNGSLVCLGAPKVP